MVTEQTATGQWRWVECEAERTLVERADGSDWFSTTSVEAGSHAAELLNAAEADAATAWALVKELKNVIVDAEKAVSHLHDMPAPGEPTLRQMFHERIWAIHNLLRPILTRADVALQAHEANANPQPSA